MLIDTYDTEAAARKVVEIAPRLAARGLGVKGVRLDSGDLAEHARRVRGILDEGGLRQAVVFASGNLDEYRVRDLVAGGAPIDGFGVGTSLVTSADAASLDSVYKLMEYAGQPRRKRSEGKATWPGRKQVFRSTGDDGRFRGDLLTVESDTAPGEPLLQQVMRSGKRLAPAPPLTAVRERALAQLALLPENLRSLEHARHYPVEVAPALQALARKVDEVTG